MMVKVDWSDFLLVSPEHLQKLRRTLERVRRGLAQVSFLVDLLEGLGIAARALVARHGEQVLLNQIDQALGTLPALAFG
jgi:hypothetical protein